MLDLNISKEWERYIKKIYSDKFWKHNVISIPDIKSENPEESINKRAKMILDYLK